jgi:phosphate:Na+ symporter
VGSPSGRMRAGEPGVDIAIAFLGGLGLFLTGLKTLSTSTKQMSGPWLRRAVAAGTRGPLASAVTGLVVGAVTQSTSAVTLVASGLVQTGMLEVRRALPLLSWTNVGTCGVVLMASLDPQTVALVLVGLAGVLAYFRLDLGSRAAPWLGALIGLGTLFLGLGIIKAGIAPLREAPFMQALMAGENHWLLPPFLVGGVIAFLSQTSSTATLIALAFTATGLMTFDQTVMAIYGASIGSGLGMLLAAGDLRGTARRLAQYQVVWKTFGTLVFLGLYALERAGVPLVLAASDALAGDLAFRVGVLVLLFQAGTALLIWSLDGPVMRLLAAWSPETPVEALSRPRFVHAAAAEDAPTAAALAGQEQARLAERLPLLLDAARGGEAAPGGPGRAALEDGSAALEAVLDGFLAEALARGGADRASLEALVALRARNADLAALREAAGGFAAVAEAAPQDAPHAPTLRQMTEALHLLLGEFAEALARPGGEGAEMLRALTADRAELLEGLRRGIARAETGLAAAQHEALLRAIATFERAVWLMRRQSLALLPGAA